MYYIYPDVIQEFLALKTGGKGCGAVWCTLCSTQSETHFFESIV